MVIVIEVIAAAAMAVIDTEYLLHTKNASKALRVQARGQAEIHQKEGELGNPDQVNNLKN